MEMQVPPNVYQMPANQFDLKNILQVEDKEGQEAIEAMFNAFVAKLRNGKPLLNALEDLQRDMPEGFTISVDVTLNAGGGNNTTIDGNSNIHDSAHSLTKGNFAVEGKTLNQVFSEEVGGISIETLGISLVNGSKETVANAQFTSGDQTGTVEFREKAVTSSFEVISQESFIAGKEYTVTVGQEFHLSIDAKANTNTGSIYKLVFVQDGGQWKYKFVRALANKKTQELSPEEAKYFEPLAPKDTRVKASFQIVFPAIASENTPPPPTKPATVENTTTSPVILLDHPRDGTQFTVKPGQPFRLEGTSTVFTVQVAGSEVKGFAYHDGNPTNIDLSPAESADLSKYIGKYNISSDGTTVTFTYDKSKSEK